MKYKAFVSILLLLETLPGSREFARFSNESLRDIPIKAYPEKRSPLELRYLKDCEEAHNPWRALHKVPPLTTGHEDLRYVAWVSVSRMFERGGDLDHLPDNQFGENLLSLWPANRPEPCSDFLRVWYDEVNQYDFNNQKFNPETGHFTQVVWKDTRRVGCHTATDGKKIILACEYDPPGNVQGTYERNVFPAG